VINYVRYQVSQGKELTEIVEMICEYCLAPDTTSDIGCDNMTILIVAITHGRSKDDWYAWITDRVKNNYGYDTPSTLPRLYPLSRLAAFRENRKAREEAAAAERNTVRFTESSIQAQPTEFLDTLPFSLLFFQRFKKWLKLQTAL